MDQLQPPNETMTCRALNWCDNNRGKIYFGLALIGVIAIAVLLQKYQEPLKALVDVNVEVLKPLFNDLGNHLTTAANFIGNLQSDHPLVAIFLETVIPLNAICLPFLGFLYWNESKTRLAGASDEQVKVGASVEKKAPRKRRDPPPGDDAAAPLARATPVKNQAQPLVAIGEQQRGGAPEQHALPANGSGLARPDWQARQTLATPPDNSALPTNVVGASRILMNFVANDAIEFYLNQDPDLRKEKAGLLEAALRFFHADNSFKEKVEEVRTQLHGRGHKNKEALFNEIINKFASVPNNEGEAIGFLSDFAGDLTTEALLTNNSSFTEKTKIWLAPSINLLLKENRSFITELVSDLALLGQKNKTKLLNDLIGQLGRPLAVDMGADDEELMVDATNEIDGAEKEEGNIAEQPMSSEDAEKFIEAFLETGDEVRLFSDEAYRSACADALKQVLATPGLQPEIYDGRVASLDDQKEQNKADLWVTALQQTAKASSE